MKDILYFDKMLTTKIITFVYWLLLLAIVIGGIGMMFKGSFFLGLLSIIGSAIAARIWCELLIVIFKINDVLQEIKTKLSEPSPT